MKKILPLFLLIVTINAQQNDILKSKYGSREFDDHIFDNKRDIDNPATLGSPPGTGYAEGTGYGSVDLLSNGFKLRATTNHTNESAKTMVYLAFAETPFKYSNAR